MAKDYEIDVVNNNEPNLERLVNLISFIYIFYVESLLKSSPDYILEKWKWFIGNIVLDKNLPIEDSESYIKYKKTWNIKDDDKIKGIFYFLSSCMNTLHLKNMINAYINFGGDLNKISSKKKKGLHPNLNRYVLLEIVDANADIIKAFVRQMKINELELE